MYIFFRGSAIIPTLNPLHSLHPSPIPAPILFTPLPTALNGFFQFSPHHDQLLLKSPGPLLLGYSSLGVLSSISGAPSSGPRAFSLFLLQYPPIPNSTSKGSSNAHQPTDAHKNHVPSTKPTKPTRPRSHSTTSPASASLPRRLVNQRNSIIIAAINDTTMTRPINASAASASPTRGIPTPSRRLGYNKYTNKNNNNTNRISLAPLNNPLSGSSFLFLKSYNARGTPTTNSTNAHGPRLTIEKPACTPHNAKLNPNTNPKTTANNETTLLSPHFFSSDNLVTRPNNKKYNKKSIQPANLL